MQRPAELPQASATKLRAQRQRLQRAAKRLLLVWGRPSPFPAKAEAVAQEPLRRGRPPPRRDRLLNLVEAKDVMRRSFSWRGSLGNLDSEDRRPMGNLQSEAIHKVEDLGRQGLDSRSST
ncbi:hypothetical protein [Bradyrhizobium sp. LMTR 3]|uniref:hypothetical protein n=1 Tax=Bradyrhizobium sp. LMTR 3 TaxID=189873 RepID=UPI000810E138|nr:hypothetical protein [Bradyrhizobium sp. LMTR 3]OCK59893.1 hypothetical protein LMTR3_19965 [Bradyrhizobium sp. LMTR 3]